jgi:hypothetical protein
MEDSHLPVDGRLRIDLADWTIVVADSLNPQRRRFTVAHEIAHALIESTGRGRPRRGKELERLCDRFAVELLMPRLEFRRSVSCGLTLANVLATAALFQTSIHSTAVRFTEMATCSFVLVRDKLIAWTAGPVDAKDPAIRNVITSQCGRDTADRPFVRTRVFDGHWNIDTREIQGDRLFMFTPYTPRS